MGLLFLLLACALLYTRNIYEDEVLSFRLIPEPISDIWVDANKTDVHPPGMYILSHLFYRLTGSERWMAIGPALILLLGLLVFAVSAIRETKFSRPALILLLLIVLMHPQILMWANSVRWYPYWTSAALVVTVTLLQIGRYRPDAACPPLSWVAAFASGIVLGSMFYLSYLTLLFVAALAIACFLRYPNHRANYFRLAVVGVVFCCIASPQVGPFLHVHLANKDSQQSSLAVAVIRMCHGIFLSEALLPWHPAAFGFLALFAVPLVLQVRSFSFPALKSYLKVGQPVWVCLFALFSVLFALACLTGTGSKPRTFLILCPILAYLAAMLVNRIKRLTVQYALLAITVLWIVGAADNLLARKGTVKGGLNDHPEEVVKIVRDKAHGACAVIFTSEPALTSVLNEAAKGENWTICSVFPDYVHTRPSALVTPCKPETAFVVESYIGALHEFRPQLQFALNMAKSSISAPQFAKLSRDNDLFFKQHVPGFKRSSADFPEYRFLLEFGPVKPNVNWKTVASAFDFYQPPEWQGISASRAATNLKAGD